MTYNNYLTDTELELLTLSILNNMSLYNINGYRELISNFTKSSTNITKPLTNITINKDNTTNKENTRNNLLNEEYLLLNEEIEIKIGEVYTIETDLIIEKNNIIKIMANK